MRSWVRRGALGGALALIGCQRLTPIEAPIEAPPAPLLEVQSPPGHIVVILRDARDSPAQMGTQSNPPLHDGNVCCRVRVRCEHDAEPLPADVLNQVGACQMEGRQPGEAAPGARIELAWPTRCPHEARVRVYVDALPDPATQCGPIRDASDDVWQNHALSELRMGFDLRCGAPLAQPLRVRRR